MPHRTGRRTFTPESLKRKALDPIWQGMLVFEMTVTSAAVTVLVAMVVLVVVTAALEARTPVPRARSTRVTIPRRVEGPTELLPLVDLVGERRRHDRQLAARMALIRGSAAGADGAGVAVGPAVPEEVAAVELPPHELPTEAVPVVVLGEWLADDEVHARAGALLAEIALSRVVPPEPWVPAEFAPTLIDPAVLGREVEREAALAAAMARYDDRRARARAGVADVEPVPVAEAVPQPEVVPHPEAVPQPEARPSTVFVATVERPGGTRVELGEPGKDRELVGALFAAYVVGGFPERNRVTGWVTANGSPPGLPALSFGAKLRGRPGRIAELLACTDEGRNWVTLDPSVAIERGLKSRKPACEVLKGVLWWWLAATDERARIPGEHIAELLVGLDAVAPHVGANPLAPTLEELRAAAVEATEAGVGIRVQSVSATTLELQRDRAATDLAATDRAATDRAAGDRAAGDHAAGDHAAELRMDGPVAGRRDNPALAR